MATAELSPNRDGVERGIIEGEPADSGFVEDARQWVVIYSELVSFTGRSLARQVDGKAGADRLPDSALGDERRLSAHLRRLISRLGFWRLRLRELVGIEIDVPRRTLTYQGMTVALTRREAQLLKFLSDNPGKTFTASQLVLHAWHATELSQEELRTYVVRLRRRIASLGLPCVLVTEPRHGYSFHLMERP